MTSDENYIDVDFNEIEETQSEEITDTTSTTTTTTSTTLDNVSKKGLSANQLKWIAIICMLIDHFTWVFIPTSTVLAQVLHIIGRTTAPIMFFFIAEGYEKTSNFNKYALRLALFGLVSFVPYMLAFYNRVFYPNPNILLLIAVIFGVFYDFKPTPFGYARSIVCGIALIPIARLSFLQPSYLNMGVIYTLLLGLIAIRVTKSSLHIGIKVPIILFIIYMTQYGDWPVVGVLYILIFSLNYGNYKKQLFWYTLNFFVLVYYFVLCYDAGFITNNFNLVSFIAGARWKIFHIGVFIPIILLYFYNGKRSNNENQTNLQKNINKWAFYIIYPAHLILLYILKF